MVAELGIFGGDANITHSFNHEDFPRFRCDNAIKPIEVRKPPEGPKPRIKKYWAHVLGVPCRVVFPCRALNVAEPYFNLSGGALHNWLKRPHSTADIERIKSIFIPSPSLFPECRANGSLDPFVHLLGFYRGSTE